MATLFTPIRALPYPDYNEYLKDVPLFIQTLATKLDKGGVPSFTGPSARDTLLPTPAAGTIAWVGSQLHLYVGTALGGWVRIWPPAPQLSSGNTAPSGTGVAGDIYVQY